MTLNNCPRQMRWKLRGLSPCGQAATSLLGCTLLFSSRGISDPLPKDDTDIPIVSETCIKVVWETGGNVKLARSVGSQFQSIKVPKKGHPTLSLMAGNQLRLSLKAYALVADVLAPKTRRRIVGQNPYLTYVVRPPVRHDRIDIPPRAQLNQRVVLSPRFGKLLSSRPSFSWSPLPILPDGSLPLYHLKLWDTSQAGTPVWELTVEGKNTAPYPRDARPLLPGREYWLQVTEDNDFAMWMEDPSPAFSLVGSNARAQMETQLRDTEAQLPTSIDRLLFRARLYAANSLYTEAIDLIKRHEGTSVASTPEWGPVYRLRGAILHCIGLPQEAKKSYQRAISLTPKEDTAGLALAYRSLAQVEIALGDVTRAGTSLSIAKQKYLELGEPFATRRIEDSLK